ncbi:Voltage-dependent T-type calcium channel subunit alpha-1I [Saguinus oedipus]|uniref:Voltage-dependent T-type calcium channel subunit alpha-1I n=1 Tax=Saguinus oedipus TaxID=9490 RepID=A0ABQ9WHD5_SAGOE|nr:Voltage-dependent T-type calcium channel subunit alpha-1I [Saguinus oedipus]
MRVWCVRPEPADRQLEVSAPTVSISADIAGWAGKLLALSSGDTARAGVQRGSTAALWPDRVSVPTPPEELTNILEICNVVFTSMFALEMILKLAAFGLFDYLRNPYNIFDSIIVIISIWEIVGQADGGLSVLRTFRLLRVLKLVRFMPALRRQLVVLMKTMDNVATFCMLLMLFIFIFSILGMHIFGCKFSLRTDTGDTVPDRKNFDSLLWAIVTVFQILTQEDWNVVLYNGMASTSPWASLYFVALMTFGNYVLFNLLVAILVEGFQAEGDANRSYSDEDQSSSNMEEFDKLQEGLDSSGDPKLCPIPMTPNGHLDPSLPLGGHLGPAGAMGPAPRLSLQPDPMLVALGSRKSSVMSLGRMSYDQRSLSSSRSSYYGPWGRSGAWASRRSSWNSLKHKPPSAEHESLLSAERVGGGARVCECAGDEGPPRAAPLHSPHAHHARHGPHLAHRHRHHRRTLSLDTRDSVDLAELVPVVGAHPRAAWRAPGPAPGHEDCNGRMPSIAKDVFTKMGDRRDRGEDEEEIDYVSRGGAEGDRSGEIGKKRVPPQVAGARAGVAGGAGASGARQEGRGQNCLHLNWAGSWERNPRWLHRMGRVRR